ncbi:MAG TPA: hypothetical protein VMH39_04295, partial [Gemmatimonadaceae bacterium]|nr:hypothetical protein [Gemmatimonadaceae bacterium]
MSRFIAAATAVLTVHAAIATRAAAQQENTKDAYQWSGRVAPGRWIRVVNLNGSITFGTAPGADVEVVATEHWRRGDPSAVRFDLQKSGADGGDVTVCALWGTRARCDSRSADEHDDNPERNNDLSVEFRVLVPRGVKVAASTVNGAVVVTGVTEEISASTVNGQVDVTGGGAPISASTVNGEVKAHVTKVNAANRMKFSAVNGNVVVDLPTDLAADVDLSTVTGSLRSDYPMTVSGRIGGQRMNAHIGSPGGPTISIST